MREQEVIALFRSTGRVMGVVTVKPPRLPRAGATLQALEREARRDPHVRRALQAAILAREQARRLEPQVVRRLFSGPITVR